MWGSERAGVWATAIAIALAGCLDASTRPNATNTTGAGGIEVSTGALPSGATIDPTRGNILGEVYDTYNLTVEGANILLLVTSNFTVSDEMGRFALIGVTPGTYTMRVDHADYNFVEQPVTVEAGRITNVFVRLVLKVDAAAAFRDHVHDLWGPDTVKTLFEGPVEFQGTAASGGSNNDLATCPLFGSSSSANKGGADDPCRQASVPIETGKLVYPGTKELRFTVTWTESDLVPKVKMVTYNASWQYFLGKHIDASEGIVPSFTHDVDLVPGTTAPLYLNDTAAQDNGHARFTAWRFLLHAESIAEGATAPSPDLVREECGPFTVKIEAVKGIVPTERPHEHFWKDGPVIDAAAFSHRLDNQQPDVPRDPTLVGSKDAGVYMTAFVPPGTTRINLTLTYAGLPQLDGYWTHKTVAFRTARIDPKYTTLEDLLTPQPSEPTALGVTKYSFRIDSANETDTFYQCRTMEFMGMKAVWCQSVWLMLLANEGAEDEPTLRNECGAWCGTDRTKMGTLYTFKFEFINENWADDFKAGRI